MATSKTGITEGTAAATIMQAYALYQQFTISRMSEGVVVQAMGILTTVYVLISRQLQKRKDG